MRRRQNAARRIARFEFSVAARFELGGLQIDLVHELFHVIVGLGDRRRVEGIRLDDVRARFEILLVDFTDDLRLRQNEQIVVAFDVVREILNRSPRYSASSELVGWIIVPMAPSRIRMRDFRAASSCCKRRVVIFAMVPGPAEGAD